MIRLFAIALAGIALSLTIAACGDDDEDTAAETTAETSESSASEPTAGAEKESGGEEKGGATPSGETEKAGITIATSDSQFGPILFDGERRAIYYFDKETSEKSECYGACAEAWPPVLTDGEPGTGGEAESNLLGTSKREDGSTQVTYAGRPLYYYVDDPPGQALCHNVDEFGGLWLVVQPGGDPVA